MEIYTYPVWTLLVLLLGPTLHANCHMPPIGNQFAVEWQWIYNDDIYMFPFDPSGAEGGQRLYLARGRVESGNWIAGKLLVRDEVMVVMANNQKEVVSTDYQVLAAPQGSLSWIPMPTDGSVPSGAIVSGMSDNDRKQYVCRGIDDHAVIPGKYVPHKKKCYVASNGKVLDLSKGECLVLNAYAVSAKVENNTEDEDQFRDKSVFNSKRGRNKLKKPEKGKPQQHTTTIKPSIGGNTSSVGHEGAPEILDVPRRNAPRIYGQRYV